MRKKPIIPKMRDAKLTFSHILRSVIPSKSGEESRMNWHNCDKMSSVGEVGAGGWATGTGGSGAVNTGGGGGCSGENGDYTGGAGGSGILIIRNHR